jgi:dGTP triphosphohydrolase
VPAIPKLSADDDGGGNIARVVDYVAGMTDRYAINLYRELSGASL